MCRAPSANRPAHARRAPLSPPPAQGADVCLADFCDVLQCDAYAAAVSPAGAAAPARCSGARALQLARSRCLLLLDDCLPPASAHAGTWRAHQLLAQQHCGQLRDCHSTQALFRSERLSTTAWRFLERLTIGIVVVALLIYYGEPCPRGALTAPCLHR